MTEDNKRIAKNTIFLYFRMFLVMGVSLMTAGVTMRVLGHVDYGLNSVLGGIVAMFSVLNGALSGAASRFVTYELGRGDFEQLNKTFNASLAVHVSLAIVIVILSETIGLWFFNNKMIIPAERMNAAFWVFQLSVISTPIALTQVPYGAVIIAHENMKIYAYTSIADVVARLVIIGSLCLSPFDKLVSLSVLHFVWSTVMVIFYRIYCISKYPETRLAFCKDLSLYKNMFQYAGSDLIGHAAGLIQGQGINLLLNIFFGPVVNAARGVAYGVQGMVTQFSNNFMTAAKPQIIKFYAAGKISEMWALVRRSSCVSYYLLLMVSLPVCLEADYLLKMWLGSYPEHTLNFLVLVIMLCLLQALRFTRGAVFHATGKLLVVNLTTNIILCLAFPLSYLLLRSGWGPEWALASVLVTSAPAEIISTLILRKYVKFSVVKYWANVHMRCLLVTVIAVFGTYFLYDKIIQPSLIRVIITSAISTLSIGIAVICVGFEPNDRQRLIEIARNRITRMCSSSGNITKS